MTERLLAKRAANGVGDRSAIPASTTEANPRNALKELGIGQDLTAISVDHPLERDADQFAAKHEALAPHFLQMARMRSDPPASRAAEAHDALAITVGDTAYFQREALTTSTKSGRELIAHEYAHILQNNREFLLRKAMGSEAGNSLKDSGSGSANYRVTIAVDREAKTFFDLATRKDLAGDKAYPVGHTWLKLKHPEGPVRSYGFWPLNGFDGSDPAKPVEGLVKHPDDIHDLHPTDREDYDFFVDRETFRKVLRYIYIQFYKQPSYTLFDYNCTTFVAEAVKAGGLAPPSYTALAIPNPNSMYEGIKRRETRVRDASGESE